MKATPEGVAMESDTAEPERQAFEILELIDALHDAHWCQSKACLSQNLEHLLDDLEESYRFAMQPWAIHRTTPGEMVQEDFFRWHEYMFPPDVYQEARRRFNELVTTSRFSVEEIPCLFDLEQVHSTNDQITKRHIVSLAVLVCIQFALEELEPLEFLGEQTGFDQTIRQIEQSRSLQKHADLWLAHLATLNQAKHETDLQSVFEQNRRSKQLQRASKLPRKESTKKLTIELVAAHWKERPGQKWESVRDELREKFRDGDTYTVSERTISRRYSEAKKINLVS